MPTTRNTIPTRRFADVFDFSVEGPQATHGVDFGSEYIGGCGGIGWYEHFKDSRTGEVYRVHCSDGVNGGKNSHTSQDEEYLTRCYLAVVERCHMEADLGSKEIYISRNERIVMQGVGHFAWLETGPGKKDGKQSKDGLEGGLVGYCHGVPVICNFELEDNLPPRMDEATILMGNVFARDTTHPELREGEVFVGNTKKLEPRKMRWRTERLGEIAYCLPPGSKEVAQDYRPIFIQRSELDHESALVRRWKTEFREASQN